MSWNHRVVRNEEGLRIFDVYYNDRGEPIATHAAPTHVHGESLEELRDQLQLMLDALEKPVLDEGEIGSQPGRSASPTGA